MNPGKLSPFENKFLVARVACVWLAVICLSWGVVAPVAADPVVDKDRDRKKDSEEVEVKNFGRVNDHIFRGSQPDDEEYQQLALRGIKTVIDLREDAKIKARILSEKAGLKYINLPLKAKQPPTKEESDRFLMLVNDQANWPVYVHCAGGRHRTGVLIAVYRMEIDGWDVNRAYEEMKEFKFYSSWGYDDMKDYVFDYYRQMIQTRTHGAPATRARAVKNSGQ